MPPAFLLLRFGSNPITVPIPIFLVWPLLLLAYLIVLPVLVVTRGRALRWGPIGSLFALLEMFRHLRGLDVQTRSGKDTFFMRFL